MQYHHLSLAISCVNDSAYICRVKVYLQIHTAAKIMDYFKFTASLFSELWPPVPWTSTFGTFAGPHGLAVVEVGGSWFLNSHKASLTCPKGPPCDVTIASHTKEAAKHLRKVTVLSRGFTLEFLKGTQTCPGQTFVVFSSKLSVHSVGDDRSLHIPCKQAQTVASAMTDCLAVTHFMLSAFLLFNSTTVILFFCIPQPSVD